MRATRPTRYLGHFLALLTLTACGGGNVPLPDLSAAMVDTTKLVAHGEYIVRNVAVCGGCHAADPRNPDGPLSGGMAFRDWRIGTIRAANLTPDSATGIGTWTEAEIVRAIRSGETRTGHLLAPVMPYEWFRGMSDRDALAVARYLKSRPAVSNEVKDRPDLALRAAKLFVLHPLRPTTPVAPPAGPTAEYGRYLATSVALCADCHTPRGGLEHAPEMDRLFAGTDSKDFPANPSNITPDSATGIGRWTEADFVRTIRTGTDPAGRKLHPFMPWHQLRRMTDSDLSAIYRYLRTLKPIQHEVPMRPGT